MTDRDRLGQPPRTGRTSTEEPGAPPPPSRESLRDSRESDGSTADQAKQQAREKAEQAKGAAQDKAREVQHKADEQRDRAASGMHQAADQIRERGEQLPGGQQTTEMAHRAADNVEDAARYVQQTDIATMTSDVEQLVRDHPKEALIAGFAAGFLIGRTLRS
ncbi:MAG: hypothetical protein R3A46_05900 [Thermomicrobiales bacterium]